MVIFFIKLFSDKKFALIVSIVFLVLITGTIASAQSAQYLVQLMVTGDTQGVVKWAVPEARVGADGTNWSTTYYLIVRDSTDYNNVLYVSSGLSTTTEAGENLNPEVFTGVASGTYDVYIKTDQHLSRKLDNVSIGEYASTTLNFTQADNSAAFGASRLLAGDINDLGTSISSLGDDTVNSVDLNIMISDLDQDDLSTKGYRSNINRDTVINSVDLGVLIDNLDKEGDR